MNKESEGTSGANAARSVNQVNADSVPPPEPYGLDTIPPGCETFFLVRGELNARYARGYVQPAVGIETWHPEYSTLAAFMHAKRIWVVLNDTEDNLSLVKSIAADKSIRRRCVVSTWGVQTVTKSKMLWDPRYSDSNSQFEAVFHFQKFPTPSEIYKIRRLGKPKPPKVYPAPRLDWPSW